MTRIAISGHRGLPDLTARRVAKTLRDELASHGGGKVIGLSCIADGPDTWFAQAVLDQGGDLIVIVPAQEYRDGLPERHHQTYDTLLEQASEVIRLDRIESDSTAHMDASIRMLQTADELLAVWDGQPARGHGGTADVVAAARDRDTPVTVIWPDGATRDT